ncbi:MAG: ABC transporter permease subunit [Anaerovoracaceae bacterium]
MRRKGERLCLFELAAMGITLGVVCFVAAILLSIVLGGIPHLGEALRTEEIQFALCLSLYTATLSTLLCIGIGIPCGYTLARGKLPFNSLLQGLIELPLSLPYLVLGMALLILFSTPLGKALREGGIPIVFHSNGIILAQFVVNLPFAIRIIRTEMSKIDPRIDFLAGTLGASTGQRFWTITLPKCRVSLLMTTVLVWSRALGEFGATLMLVGVTRMKTETLPGSIYLNISTGENGMAMASAMMMLIFSALGLGLTSVCNYRLRLRSRMKKFI